MSKNSFVCVVVCLLAALALAGCRSNPEPAAPAPAGAEPNLDGLAASGKYDEAVRLGEEKLKSNPGDKNLLLRMSDWSFHRAHAAEGEQKDALLREAVRWADQAVQHHGSDETMLRRAANTFKVAGDRSEALRCEFYNRSLQILRLRAPLLEEDAPPLPESDSQRSAPKSLLREDNIQRIDQMREAVNSLNCNPWVE